MNDFIFTNRITPNLITSLESNEVFVFGSNLKGKHGAGAAKTALKWGAKYGTYYGLSGKTFAIPTKISPYESMPLESIKFYVNGFIAFAKKTTNLTYLVTEVGCGLAGYNPENIAPLFKEVIDLENVCLPQKFWDVLNNKNRLVK